MMDDHPESEAEPPVPELASLRDVPVVPKELEARVVASLRARGRLGGRRGRLWRGGSRAVVAAAAALLLFLAGHTVGRRGRPAPVEPGQPRWMLLLYEGPDFDQPAPGTEGRRVEEYRQWAAAIAGTGRLVDGAELTGTGLVLEAGIAPREAADPTFRLGGYFVIEAATLSEAAGVARTAPHLAYRGRIVVRSLGGEAGDPR